MSRLVVLKLNGDLERQGFQVTVEVGQEGYYPALSEEGELPPSPEVASALAQWQETYTRLAQPSRAIKPYKIQYDGAIHPLEACIASANRLAQTFQQWLRSQSFLEMEMQLRRVLAPNDVIRVVVRSPNRQLHGLPWHLWQFIDDYPQAEIAMGACRFQRGVEELPWQPSMTPQVTILAVLGDRENIDVESDRQLLNALPGAQVKLLVEPTPQELHDWLYQTSWDILFFAGHSDTREDGQGIIRLNPTTTLTIEELKYAVRQASANGLQLAIFNSCNGLGLAHALADLQLPQAIVMREAIPDSVAHTFLKYFLEAFSQGMPLYQAARRARERLQGLEKTYPCASWLPAIYQHPGRTPPSWQDLQQRSSPSDSPGSSTQKGRVRRQRAFQTALVSFAVTSVVMGARFLGGLQPLELWALDSLMGRRPAEGPDHRMLIVTIDEADLRYQDEQGYERDGSLSNQALAAALQKLEPYNPAVVGVDIFRDRPLYTKPEPVAKVSELTQANDAPHTFAGQRLGQLAAQSPLLGAQYILPLPDVTAVGQPAANTQTHPFTNTIFICQIQTGENFATVSPPPDIEPVQLGFSNIILDPDRRIRRHLIAMANDPDCNTDRSFSFRVAGNYLQQVSDFRVTLRHGILTIDGIEFPRFNRHSGAYHSLDMGGYNTLLNYRATEAIAPTISLSELLEGTQDGRLAELVRDRVVLIGTIARSFNDYHLTPYGEMAGVEVQAHMISQILSAVEDNRPLLRSMPQWGDVLWVYVWALGTGGVMLLLRTRSQTILAVIVTFSCLSLLCFWALQMGWWLPLVPTAIGCAAMTGLIQRSRAMGKQA